MGLLLFCEAHIQYAESIPAKWMRTAHAPCHYGLSRNPKVNVL